MVDWCSATPLCPKRGDTAHPEDGRQPSPSSFEHSGTTLDADRGCMPIHLRTQVLLSRIARAKGVRDWPLSRAD
eukprot:scaffold4405_cov336-Prasinococcus_capsulatus_cf.AAC.2